MSRACRAPAPPCCIGFIVTSPLAGLVLLDDLLRAVVRFFEEPTEACQEWSQNLSRISRGIHMYTWRHHSFWSVLLNSCKRTCLCKRNTCATCDIVASMCAHTYV